jgi:hypothetical protein
MPRALRLRGGPNANVSLSRKIREPYHECKTEYRADENGKDSLPINATAQNATRWLKGLREPV